MAQPPSYTKSTSFAQDERDNAGGRSTVRTDRLDAELSAVATTLAATLANLALLQRDDGKIRDGIVELFHLSAATRLALQTIVVPRGLWATLVVYAVGDLIDRSGASYMCSVAHTAGVFDTDYAAGRWQIFGAVANAGALPFTPPATMTAVNVQAAIEEVNTRARTLAHPTLATMYGAL